MRIVLRILRLNYPIGICPILRVRRANLLSRHGVAFIHTSNKLADMADRSGVLVAGTPPITVQL